MDTEQLLAELDRNPAITRALAVPDFGRLEPVQAMRWGLQRQLNLAVFRLSELGVPEEILARTLGSFNLDELVISPVHGEPLGTPPASLTPRQAQVWTQVEQTVREVREGGYLVAQYIIAVALEDLGDSGPTGGP